MGFTQNVIIKSTADKLFSAVTQDVEKWWGKTDLSVKKLGDIFTIRFGETYWTFHISEFILNEKIIWECIAAKHVHEGYDNIEQEWVGTQVIWEINKMGDDSVELVFKHRGLTEDLNCYDICVAGWEQFVTNSLKQFVETGTGAPYFP